LKKRITQFVSSYFITKSSAENQPFLSGLFRPFGYFAPKDFKMIWLSNILTFSVHDEGYSERT
jgi:hypothetical protein